MNEYLPPSHQGDWIEPSKFDQLRFKTEKQLVQILNNELDLGIRYARQALRSADMWIVAEEDYRRAKSAYSGAARLIPLVTEITMAGRVESKAENLQGMLEALSVIGSTPMPAENQIAVLARAVWEARDCPEGLPEEDWFRAERALKTQRRSNAVCV